MVGIRHRRKKYQYISDQVEPHPNLVIAIKHCEGDFHRGNPFSKVLGLGRHQQLVEVQCAREYEGKGAYPNYIARGVIEGFEEDRAKRKKASTGASAIFIIRVSWSVCGPGRAVADGKDLILKMSFGATLMHG